MATDKNCSITETKLSPQQNHTFLTMAALNAKIRESLGFSIGLEDDFFDLAIDSLQIAAMVDVLNYEFGSSLTIIDVIECGTLGTLIRKMGIRVE